MDNTVFVSFVTEKGIVVKVEGKLEHSEGFWGTKVNWIGLDITTALNNAHEEGYEAYDIEIIDDKKVHRLKMIQK
jgi:hypothetical protein